MLQMEKTHSTQELLTRSKTFKVRITAPAARTANATAKTSDYNKQKEDASDTSHWHMELRASAFKVVALKETHIQGKQS